MRLSYTAVSKFLTCPRQYQYYYIDGWREKQRPAKLVFGQNVHSVIETLLIEPDLSHEEAVKHFEHSWEKTKTENLKFSARETWEGLLDTGKKLVARFGEEERWKIRQVIAIERLVGRSLSLGVEFIGYLDIAGEVLNPDTGEVVPAIVDIKTSSSDYNPVQVKLSHQLTLYYALASQIWSPLPDNLHVGFVVFKKTKTPEITWHLTTRVPEQVTEAWRVVDWVNHTIMTAELPFPQSVGMQCAWCPFAALCLGDKERTEQELVKATAGEEEEDAED